LEPAGGVPPGVVPGFVVAGSLEQLSRTDGTSTSTVPPSKNFWTTSLLFIVINIKCYMFHKQYTEDIVWNDSKLKTARKDAKTQRRKVAKI
jgi:hypothetical protein